MENGIKLDIGCGRMKPDGYIGIDCVQIIDGNGDKKVDVVMDIEKTSLPYISDTVDEIRAFNVLEHLANLRFVLNDCHRVLKKDGFLWGTVPLAGTEKDFQDPTHQRHFIKKTFLYFTGRNDAFPDQPSHPRYANYGYKPWDEVEVRVDGQDIWFKLKPRK